MRCVRCRELPLAFRPTELIDNRSPFSTAQTQAELIAMVKSGRLPPLPATISPELTQVIRAMLTLNVRVHVVTRGRSC